MEDQNIVIFLDKTKKLMELGNIQKAVLDIDTLIILLEHNITHKKGKIITPLPIPKIEEISNATQLSLDNRKKLDEIIQFINRRFSF